MPKACDHCIEINWWQRPIPFAITLPTLFVSFLGIVIGPQPYWKGQSGLEILHIACIALFSTILFVWLLFFFRNNVVGRRLYVIFDTQRNIHLHRENPFERIGVAVQEGSIIGPKTGREAAVLNRSNSIVAAAFRLGGYFRSCYPLILDSTARWHISNSWDTTLEFTAPDQEHGVPTRISFSLLESTAASILYVLDDTWDFPDLAKRLDYGKWNRACLEELCDFLIQKSKEIEGGIDQSIYPQILREFLQRKRGEGLPACKAVYAHQWPGNQKVWEIAVATLASQSKKDEGAACSATSP